MLRPLPLACLGPVLALGLLVPTWVGAQTEMDPVNEALYQRALSLGSADRDQAERLLRTVLDSLQKRSPPPKVEIARVMEQLSSVYLGKQDFMSALDVDEWLYQYALETYAADSSEILFRGFFLGRTYLRNERLEEAEALLARILPLIEKTPEMGSRMHGMVISMLAQVRLRQGRPNEAEALAYRAVDLVLSRSAVPPTDAYLLVGRVQLRQGRLPEAEKAVRRALVVQEHLGSSAGSRPTIEALNMLAFILEARGEVAAANTLFRRGLGLATRMSATDRVRLTPIARHLALFEAASAGTTASVPPLTPATSAAEAGALEDSGNLLRDIGRPSEAAEAYRTALAGLTRDSIRHRAGIVRLQASLAAVLAEADRRPEAEQTLRLAIAHCEQDPAHLEGFKKALQARLAELGQSSGSGP